MKITQEQKTAIELAILSVINPIRTKLLTQGFETMAKAEFALAQAIRPMVNAVKVDLEKETVPEMEEGTVCVLGGKWVGLQIQSTREICIVDARDLLDCLGDPFIRAGQKLGPDEHISNVLGLRDAVFFQPHEIMMTFGPDEVQEMWSGGEFNVDFGPEW